MNYLLDTDAVIALLKDQPPAVRTRLRRVVARGSVVAVSSIVLDELWYGVARSERRRENTKRLRVFLASTLNVVPFDEEDAAVAGELRATLERAGTPIGPYDLLIAAQALRGGQRSGHRERAGVRAGPWARVAGLVDKILTRWLFASDEPRNPVAMSCMEAPMTSIGRSRK